MWVGEQDYDAALNGFDPGVGISRVSWRSPNDSKWGGERNEKPASGQVQMHECEEPRCGGASLLIAEDPEPREGRPPPLSTLPDGEDTIEGVVEDGVGLTATATATVKVDTSKPQLELVGLPADDEVGFGLDHMSSRRHKARVARPHPGSWKCPRRSTSRLRLADLTAAPVQRERRAPGRANGRSTAKNTPQASIS